MAGVQRYDGQIEAAPLPGVRVNGGAPVEAFGGGAALQGFEAAGRAMDSLQKLARDERDKANQERAKKAYAELLQKKNARLYGKEGLVTKRGEAAFDAHDVFLPAFEQDATEIEASLANEDQKAMFRVWRGQETAEFTGAVDRHVAQERDRWQGDNHKFVVANIKEDAVLNREAAPWKLGDAMSRIEAETIKEADRLGLGTEGRQALIRANKSDLHSSVIQDMLTKDQDVAAEKYFADHRADMTDQDAKRIGPALEEGSRRGQSQRIADALLARFPMPGAEGLAAARKAMKDEVTDPKLRDAVDERLSREYQLMDRTHEAAQEQLFTRIWNGLEQTKSLDKADPEKAIATLDPKYQATLRKFEADLLSGKEPVPDAKVYTRFATMPAAELAGVTPGRFLSEVYPHVTRGEYHELLNRWRMAKEAATGSNRKASAEFKSVMSDDELVLSTLAKSKVGGITDTDTTGSIHKDEGKAATFKEFRRRLNDAMEADFAATGRNPDDKRKRELMDRLLLDKVMIRKKRFGIDRLASDVEKPASTLTEEERAQVYVPYDKIPDAARAEIAQALALAKHYPTNDMIERAYGAWITGNRDLYNSILQGR